MTQESIIDFQELLILLVVFFGGQIKNTLKFIEYYYETVREFIKRKIFCGKEQTLFAYVAFAHPEVVKLIYLKIYKGFIYYLS